MAHFKVSESENHLWLDFSAPSAGNALGLAVARELSGLVRRYRGWKKPVIVGSTHPTLFCSGGNLSDYKKMKGKAPGLKVNREIENSLNAFGSWPVVKLAVVEGDVLGGGMEWLSRFDFRWSTPSAFFSFWQRRIGLSPGWGGGRAWASLIGEARVRAALMEANVMSASAALRWGLVDRVVPSWKIREDVVEWAAWMQSPSVREAWRWTVKGDRALFTKLWMGPEHRAALARWRA